VLIDERGNEMAFPVVPTVTTLPDVTPPGLAVRQPCGMPVLDSCTATPGLKYCANVGPTYLDMFFDIYEGGAVYFMLTKLPANESLSEQYECEQLLIRPGEMYEVPSEQKWHGCLPPQGRRRLSSVSALRGYKGPMLAQRRSEDHWIGKMSAEVSSKRCDFSQIHQRRRLMHSLSPRFGTATDKPCACCTPDLNCKLDFNEVWGSRMNLEEAGVVLQSGCGYFDVSGCSLLPVMEGFSASVNGTRNGTTAPAVPARLSAGTMATAPERMLLQRDAVMSEVSESIGRVEDQSSQWTAAPTIFVEQQRTAAYNVSGHGSSFKHPLYTSSHFTGIEPAAFYAFYAVGEDRNQPNPNLHAVAKQWIFRAQAIGSPACEVSCSLQQSTVDSLQINVKMNSTGRVYYMLQVFGDHEEPTVAQVCSGIHKVVVSAMR
jgi:hypothetical protein